MWWAWFGLGLVSGFVGAWVMMLILAWCVSASKHEALSELESGRRDSSVR